MRAPPESGWLQTLYYSLSLGHPWRMVCREILPVGRTLRRGLCCSLCLEGEVASDVLIHGLWPVVWLDGQGLGRNMIGKLVTKLGRKECGWDLSSYSPLPCRSQTTRLLLVPQTLQSLYLPFTPARPLDEVAFPATLWLLPVYCPCSSHQSILSSVLFLHVCLLPVPPYHTHTHIRMQSLQAQPHLPCSLWFVLLPSACGKHFISIAQMGEWRMW